MKLLKLWIIEAAPSIDESGKRNEQENRCTWRMMIFRIGSGHERGRCILLFVILHDSLAVYIHVDRRKHLPGFIVT